MDTVITSTLTSKGQVTVPKQIRDRLKLRAGDRIDFRIDEQGHVDIRARNVDVRELKGIVRSKRKTAPSIEAMNEAIARGWSGA